MEMGEPESDDDTDRPTKLVDALFWAKQLMHISFPCINWVTCSMYASVEVLEYLIKNLSFLNSFRNTTRIDSDRSGLVAANAYVLIRGLMF